jgi:uncharacterized LabA/DUF88 family protein
MTARRVSVYIDGFNLYHAIDDLGENHLKWLDLWTLSETLIRPDETVSAVKYFSAYATWMPEGYRRHQRYIAALEAKGVKFIEGRFKEKPMQCKKCGVRYIAHEEKETDVNIGVHLMADGLKDRFDRALVISADTDLNEAVTLAKAEATGKQIAIVAPPKRKGRNSNALFEVTVGRLRRSLLPEQIVWDGKTIIRPTEYDPPAI